ncbi:glycerophosphodiester phosphodiesterase [Congregibacter variabilis]|uniref:glycerophosphodiester phosphodiesterase n=1 Tax=Congregibacter variabilis TaxID=3081200 RepID=A0ABZ0HZK0_9GAMM|nr:glycerophosphodiester phosphodiesterase [Congregibacter sp. IMCC43200]
MTTEQPIVIAHRGASAYLPEHTLPAKAMAHAMGADFIEQDVVLTHDGVPIVLHDIHLDSTTDVAKVFPGRARADGRFYAIDFTLAEIRRLKAHERRSPNGEAVFPRRFPAIDGISGIPTLAEEIALIDGLNRSRDHQAGLYVEMKASAFHRTEGQNLPAAVMQVLTDADWDQRKDRVFLQSFEPDALRQLKYELKTVLPLVQLIAENAWDESGSVDFDAMRTDAGLDAVAEYADGIGPWLMQLYQGVDDQGKHQVTDLAERAHARGLIVHPYTFRADQLPPGIDSFEELHRLFFEELQVDGVFSDFPDRSRALSEKFANTAKASP